MFVTDAVGSENQPAQVTNLNSPVSSIRWHPSGEWIFFISDGNVFVTYLGSSSGFGRTIQLSNDLQPRDQLVVSQDGNLLAYIIPLPTKDESGAIVKDALGNDFRQIFCMELDWNSIK